VSYEDIVERHQDALKGIFALLDVPFMPLTTRMTKQNPAPAWETVANYEQLKNHFRHTQWSALFEGAGPMKILFLHIPSLSQYRAIEPILLELDRRGHQVIHYNEAGFRQYIENTNIRFTPYRNYQGYFMSLFRATMDLYEFGFLLLETAEHMMGFVEEEVFAESPDLIMHSKFVGAPKAVARRRGIPAVCLTPAAFFHPRTLREGKLGRSAPDMSSVSSLLRFRRRARSFYGAYMKDNVDPDDIFVNDEALNLVLTLEAFQPGRECLPAHCRFVGPTVHIDQYSKSYDLIYASLGSVFTDNPSFFETCIQAFGTFGRRAVVSLGDRFSPRDFDNVPDNIELRRFVRQKQVLQQAAVFVTHGGDSSVAEAIYCATPMIVVPQILEQSLRARQVERLMLGKHIDPADLTVATLRSAVEDLLGNPVFRSNVQAMKDSLPKAPPAVTACDEIEKFASGGSNSGQLT
jgi:MGT family glycosyltransferase